MEKQYVSLKDLKTQQKVERMSKMEHNMSVTDPSKLCLVTPPGLKISRKHKQNEGF